MLRLLKGQGLHGWSRLLDSSCISISRTCSPAAHITCDNTVNYARAKPAPKPVPRHKAPSRPRKDEISIFYKPSPRIVNINLHGRGDAKETPLTGESEILLKLRFNDSFKNEVLQIVAKAERQEKILEEREISTADIKWKESQLDYSKLSKFYQRLAKRDLTLMVVITAAAGYAIAPGAFDLTTFALCCTGTALTSSAANTINQFLEVPYDSQMPRTYTRPLVVGAISPLHAVGFAGASTITGVAMLYWGVNPLVAGLGLFNLVLYTSVYTPMKRFSIANTWAGAVVGGIPPMMGWAACAGALDPGAWVLGAILFSWQFPHFNALSWKHRAGYSRAGYRMTSVVNPEMCKRVALRHSLILCGLVALPPILGVTKTLAWIPLALGVNGYLALNAWKFYKNANSSTSTSLFYASLIHLPALMILLWLCSYFDDQWLTGKPELLRESTRTVKTIS